MKRVNLLLNRIYAYYFTELQNKLYKQFLLNRKIKTIFLNDAINVSNNK